MATKTQLAAKRAARTHQLPAGALAAAGAATPTNTAALQAPAPVAPPAPAPQNPAQVALAALLAQLQGTMAATQAGAATPTPMAVALRGGPVVQYVALTNRPYRVAAAHNQAWWATMLQTMANNGGTASVASLLAAGVPANFVGYVLRRGHVQACAAPATT